MLSNQLRTNEAKNWQKNENSQPQLKIYWFFEKECSCKRSRFIYKTTMTRLKVFQSEKTGLNLTWRVDQTKTLIRFILCKVL